jgi:hypothetical protein
MASSTEPFGVMALPASLLAGLLWDWYGPPAPFLFDGALALVSAAAMVFGAPSRTDAKNS